MCGVCGVCGVCDEKFPVSLRQAAVRRQSKCSGIIVRFDIDRVVAARVEKVTDCLRNAPK